MFDLRTLVAGIEPHDALAHTHRAEALAWIDSGVPRVRAEAPDRHLVSYFVVRDPHHDTLLLVDHRKAGLLLPTGGHVEPGEDPWQTVVRECHEELAIEAVPAAFGARPAFLTITATRGAVPHVDVSLWFLLEAARESVRWYDPAEFAGLQWLTPGEVRATPIDRLDPHMHRFLDVL